MSKHEDYLTKRKVVQGLIDGWKSEYGVEEFNIEFTGWRKLHADNPHGLRLGQYNGYHDPLRCEIHLDDGWEDNSLGWLETSVLWHEFCHAVAYLEDGKCDAHNKHWFNLTWRKPWYVIGDWVAKAVYFMM